MPKLDSQTIQLIIIAIAGAAVVMQAIVLVAILVSLKKTASSVQAQIEGLRTALLPLILNSREFFTNSTEFFTRVAPTIEATTIDVSEIVHGFRIRGAELESSASNALARLNQQMMRMDAMLTEFLDSVERFSGFMVETVDKPARQLAGMLAAAKAVVEALRTPTHPSRNSTGNNTPML